MRMWMIDPKLLCNRHLLGEHGEIHKFRHTFIKKYSIKGRIFPIVQIEPFYMETRHNELVDEMLKRGFNHKSPYIQPDLSYLGEFLNIKVNLEESKIDLINRCLDCKEKINQKG